MTVARPKTPPKAGLGLPPHTTQRSDPWPVSGTDGFVVAMSGTEVAGHRLAPLARRSADTSAAKSVLVR